MVKTSPHTLGLDPRVLKKTKEPFRQLGRAAIGIFSRVEMSWESAKVVDELEIFRSVDFDCVSIALPVGGEDHYSFGAHLLRDFAADGLEFAVDRVCFEKLS